ncbi:hypothetical protein M3152_00140 [Sporosarcina luteola]|uniref:hypothetical protein n=1 Tax=Bacillales TaxID=1385 RepID=UPI002040B988|nr:MULTISPECIES: hypothetical protein [Bacillales]MCM3636108.1 hypothetical protein [Sporosarcina luteola]
MKSKLLIGSIVLVTGISITVVCIYTGMKNVSADNEIENIKMEHAKADNDIENIKVVEETKESTEPLTKAYDKEEIGMWISEINAILSAPLDDPRLIEANYDEGFEYYLKAQQVKDLYPNTEDLSGTEFGIEYDNLTMFANWILHEQFVRTAHLDSYGRAKEDTSLSDKWKPVHHNMRQSFEYLKQLANDLDVALNHDGQGETFGVTHLLKGDKVSEMEAFGTGKSSRMDD